MIAGTAFWCHTLAFIYLCPGITWVQESLRPYPWPRSRSPKRGGSPPHLQSTDVKTSTGDTSGSSLTPAMEQSWGIKLRKSSNNLGDDEDHCDETLGVLRYMLPSPGVTAGRVLHHAKCSVATLLRKNEPMIYKIGYTHDPVWRWSNKLYGYKFAKDRWSHMVVLYQSVEPFGPAMLEACLIDMFKGILLWYRPSFSQTTKTLIYVGKCGHWIYCI